MSIVVKYAKNAVCDSLVGLAADLMEVRSQEISDVIKSLIKEGGPRQAAVTKLRARNKATRQAIDHMRKHAGGWS